MIRAARQSLLQTRINVSYNQSVTTSQSSLSHLSSNIASTSTARDSCGQVLKSPVKKKQQQQIFYKKKTR